MKRIKNIINTTILGLLFLFILINLLSHTEMVQRFIASQLASQLSKKLGTEVVISKVHLGILNRIIIDDFNLTDQKNKKLLLAKRFTVKINYLSLIKGEVNISSIQLFGADINLYKKDKYSKYNFQFLIDSLQSKDSTNNTPLNLQINSIIIRHGKVAYNILNEPLIRNKFSTNHINIKDVSGHLIINKLREDSINMVVKRLSLQERNGFNLSALQLKLIANNQKATLQDLFIKVGNSSASANKIEATYIKKDKEYLLPSLQFHGKVDAIRLSPKDLNYFTHIHYTNSGNLLGSLSFKGTGTSLYINDLNIYSSRKDLQLKAQAYLRGRFEKPQWYIGINHFYTTQHSLYSLLNTFLSPKEIPTFITTFDWISYKGDMGGLGKNTSLKGLFKSNLGDIKIGTRLQGRQFEAKIQTEKFNIQKLTNQKQLNLVALNLMLQGDVIDNKLNNIYVKGLIPFIDYNQYTYKNINIDGSYKNKIAIGKLQIDDKNGFIDITGKIANKNNLYEGTIDATCQQLNPHALNLTPLYPKTTFSAHVSSSFKGQKLNNFEGNISVSNFYMVSPDLHYHIKDFTATAFSKHKRQAVHIESDFGKVFIDGSFEYQKLSQTITNLIGHTLPTIPGLPPINHNTNNQININAHITKSDWLKHLVHVDLDLQTPLTINGFINEKKKDVSITCQVDTFTYQNKKYSDTYLHVFGDDNSLQAEGGITSISNETNKFQIGVKAKASNNHLNTILSFNNHNVKTLRGEINTETSFFSDDKGRSTANVLFKPSCVMVGDSIWNVHPSSIVYRENYLTITDFKLSHQNQYLAINGTATKDLKESVVVNFNDIDVNYILNFVDFHAVEFEGNASGNAFIAAALGNPQAFANIKVENFKFEKGNMGTLNADIEWDRKEQQINIDAIAQEEDKHYTDIKGYVSPQKNYIDLSINAHNSNIAFVETFTSSFMRNVQARANGEVRLFGDLNKINLTGKLAATGSLGITSLNTTYTMNDSKISFIPNEIIFENDTIHDKYGNTGIVTGKLYHKNLTNLTYKVNVKANNLLSYDTHTFGNNTFYGTAFVKGDCSIIGDDKGVVIDVTGTTQKGSMLVYNVSNTSTITNKEYIYWNDNNNNHPKEGSFTTSFNNSEQKIYNHVNNNIHVNFLINCTPDATIKLIMDENSGDNIILKGSGGLRASYYNKGGFDMFGNYLVDEGSYKLTVQNIIKKEFRFEKGGSITFGGNPYAATLRLKALYPINSVSLSDLQLGRSFTENNIKVNCIMNITGTPATPKIDFDLDMPATSNDIKQMVLNLIDGEKELNQQVLYLLAVGRFYIKGNDNTANNETEQQSQTYLAMQSLLSGTVSQQINSLLSSVLNNSNWNFGTNISTGNEGWNNAEYEGLLSGKLLNNRLIIDGQFGYRDNAKTTTSFIGDFNVKYLLTPSGSFSVNMYNQTNDRYFTRNSLNTQGIGLLIKKDFNNFSDLFSRKKKVMKKKSKDKTVVTH